MQRFYTPDNAGEPELRFTKQHPLYHQITRVLRFQVGDTVCLFNAQDSYNYLYEISKIHKTEIILTYKAMQEYTINHPYHLYLYQAIPKKKETYELILQKGCELGMQSITPLETKHTQKAILPKPERQELIVKEALEQSEQNFFPNINESKPLESLFPLPKNSIVCRARDTHTQTLWAYIQTVPKQSDVHLFIGPEGGFSDQEIEAFINDPNAQMVSLTDTILRSETASIVASGIILSQGS